MARDSDEDALSWGDESDPTYLDTRAQPSKPSAAPASDADNDADADEDAVERDVTEPSTATPSQSSRPTLAERRAASSGNATPASSSDAASDAVSEPAPMSSLVLLVLGVLAGVYLLYTYGWFTTAANNIAIPVQPLDVAMAQFREYLSVAAPALWFATTLLLTRGRKASVRVLGLVLGAIVLMPLEFVFGI